MGELLAKVGLGERLKGALEWAGSHQITSVQAMHGLLTLQEHLWDSLLAAVGPTKAYHKMRIAAQLKKMADASATTGGKKLATKRTAADVFWGKVDYGKVEYGSPDAEDGSLTERNRS